MKQLLKRFLSLTLAVAVIAVCLVFAPTTSAATTSNIAIEATSKNVQPGETFTVDINITSNPGIVSLRLFVEYDTEVLTLVGAEDKGVLGTSQFTDTYGSPFRLVWSNGAATTNYTVTGTIATLTFEASDNIEEITTATVAVSTQSTNDILSVDASTLDLIPVTPNFTNSTVTVGIKHDTHSFGNWTVEKEATRTENGSKYRECECGEIESAVIPRLIRFNSLTITFANNIAINMKANADYFTDIGYTDPYAVFVLNGKTTTVTDYTVEESTGRYIFTFDNNTPQTINDQISIYLYATYNGELYCSEVLNYRITDYCYTLLNDSTTDDKFKSVLVDLLNYATAAQLYKGHNTANLSNANLTEEQQSWGTTTTREYTSVLDSKYKVIDSPTAAFRAVNVSLDSSVEMFFAFTLPSDLSDLSNITISCTNGLTDWTITSDKFTYDSANSRYTVYFDGLAAHQLDDKIEVTVYNGNKAISNTLLFSVESYVATQIANTSNSTEFLNVLRSMMNYGDSANAYKLSQNQ